MIGGDHGALELERGRHVSRLLGELRVVAAGRASPAQLAQRLPYDDYRMERLLLLNGVDSPAALARLPLIKIVEP